MFLLVRRSRTRRRQIRPIVRVRAKIRRMRGSKARSVWGARLGMLYIAAMLAEIRGVEIAERVRAAMVLRAKEVRIIRVERVRT